MGRTTHSGYAFDAAEKGRRRLHTEKRGRWRGLSHVGRPRTRPQSLLRASTPDHPHDRLARRLSGTTSRRQALAALGALGAVRLHPTEAASQLEVATCGEEGAVCTHLNGCCEGLVCATSHINPNYGVCIPGDGEHLAVTTQLVVPGDDAVVTTLTAELADTEAAAADAETVLAEQAAAKDSRRSTRRSRKDTQRSQKRSRKTRSAHQALPPDEHHDGNHHDLYGAASDVFECGRVLCQDRELPGHLLRRPE